MATSSSSAAPDLWRLPVAVQLTFAGSRAFYFMRLAAQTIMDIVASVHSMETSCSVAMSDDITVVLLCGEHSLRVPLWLSLGACLSFSSSSTPDVVVVRLSMTVRHAMPRPRPLGMEGFNVANSFKLFNESVKQHYALMGLPTLFAGDSNQELFNAIAREGEGMPPASDVPLVLRQRAHRALQHPSCRYLPVRAVIPEHLLKQSSATGSLSENTAAALPPSLTLVQRRISREVEGEKTTLLVALMLLLGNAVCERVFDGSLACYLNGVRLPLSTLGASTSDTRARAAGGSNDSWGTHDRASAVTAYGTVLSLPLDDVYLQLAGPDGYLLFCITP